MSQGSRWLEQLWYEKDRPYWYLLPLAWLYAALTGIRRGLFRIGLMKQYRHAVPVIVVGNISIGGTGKTPFTLKLCHLLRQQGWRPGIVSRGYGADIRQPTLVNVNSPAGQVGDEPLLLAQRSGAPVVVCPDRVAAVQYLLQHTQCDIVISDDGLQHYRLARDVEIVLIDGSRGFGNGQLLPAGPLREGIWRLKLVDLVVANTQLDVLADGLMQLTPAAPVALVGDACLSQGTEVILVAGIGNPARFERTVLEAGFNISATRFFSDHHQFTEADLADIPGPLLMTEKDAVKCRNFAKPNWFSLGVDAKLDSALTTKLHLILTKLRSRNGT